MKVHWPYVLTELAFVAYQLGWAILFAANGLWWCALVAVCLAGSVLLLVVNYGDHAGRILFVIDRRRPDEAAT